MKRVVHISDLHFGRVDKKRVKPIISKIQELKPDIVVISGDFTQRAKEKEFKDAKKFIKDLKYPVFVIPGNHDIPLYNFFKRMLFPFTNYKKYISTDFAPVYTDDEIAIFGVNSVRRFAITSGKIRKAQLQTIENQAKELPDHILKIVVSHHPFDLPFNKKTHHNITHKVIARSQYAMKRLSQIGINIFLSGHLHVHHISDTSLRYKIDGYRALIIQAGTAISTRFRGEPVSFNVIDIDKPVITIKHYSGFHRGAVFNLISTETYSYKENHLVKVK